MSPSPTPRVAAAAGVGPDPRAAIPAALEQVGNILGDLPVDLAVVFLGADYVDAAEDVVARVTEALGPAHLVGVSAQGVVANGSELEHGSSLALWAAHLPGAAVTPLRYEPPRQHASSGAAQEALGEGWPEPPDDAAAVVLLADPFSFPPDAFLAWLAQARPELPVCGGLASGALQPGGNRLLLDGVLYRDGAVGVALSGVAVRTLVSQGCRPVGRSYVVTRAERNLVHELGGQSPIERVREAYAGADRRDQALLRSGLHIGTVIDEYREEFGRGDFLVRGVLGVDAASGALAVGDVVRVGQTVQFHVRDADSADEDLAALLDDLHDDAPVGGLLFTCNGRGSRLFDVPDHDASAVVDHLGDMALAGFFCAGEFGPVAGRSFLHGFTASLLLID